MPVSHLNGKKKKKKQEIQRQRQLEEAVSHRKRSSRLAVKESEKEEARLAAMKKAEEEEKLSRARRLEARQKREEDQRLKREAAREQRRLDREERERMGAGQPWVIFLGHFRKSLSLADRIRVCWSMSSEMTHNHAKLPLTCLKPGQADQKRGHLLRLTPRPAQVVREHQWAKTGYWTAISVIVLGSTRSVNSPIPRGNDRLHSRKLLQDDGSPLLCCGKCAKWQHIACHDLADRQAGRPMRDWDREEFICRACLDRGVVNGKQVLNGSASYDTGQTPNSHHQAAYSGHVPYSSAYPPHTPRPYQRHTAITFTHYQPQQHGFSSAQALHAQSMIPAAAAATATTYTQPHYSPSKSAQYTAVQASATVRMSIMAQT
jgi:hypothetical protein